MNHYDVCVIGCGPAGFAAAMRAWDYGKSVCVVERGPLGGAGVHNGALASKTFWELSKDYRNALRRDRGFVAAKVEVNFDQVAHSVETSVNQKTRQLERQFRALSSPTPGHDGLITHIVGSARFEDAKQLFIEGTEAGDNKRITADYFVVATGSRPRTLPSVLIDGKHIMTSDQILRCDSFPRSLVIIGAGVIGCEFATIFSNYGRTKVNIIDRADRILPAEDADIAQLCASRMEAKGVTIHRGSRLQSVKVVNGEVEYCISHKTGGLETIRVEKALVSIGREPNTRGLDLEKAGVELTDRGHIVDNDTRTTVPHIFAIGDVTLDMALVSVAEIEGRHAIEHMFGAKTLKPLEYDNISTIMFLDPEVAAVGLNELQAQDKRIPYRVAVYGFNLVNRAIAMHATTGFIKLLVSDDEEMLLLGMRALGAHASTAIEAVSLMIKQGRSVRELAELLHPHPAMTEALQDCVRMLLGTSIMKPIVFQEDLRLSRIVYSVPAAPEKTTAQSEKKAPAKK